MDNNTKLIESLIEKAVDFGKTSFELGKLKALDKTSDAVSSIIPHSLVFVLIMLFFLFINLGLAFWVGEILGKIYFGFFVVAGFYVLAGIITHFLLHRWIKNRIWNYIVKLALK